MRFYETPYEEQLPKSVIDKTNYYSSLKLPYEKLRKKIHLSIQKIPSDLKDQSWRISGEFLMTMSVMYKKYGEVYFIDECLADLLSKTNTVNIPISNLVINVKSNVYTFPEGYTLLKEDAVQQVKSIHIHKEILNNGILLSYLFYCGDYIYNHGEDMITQNTTIDELVVKVVKLHGQYFGKLIQFVFNLIAYQLYSDYSKEFVKSTIIELPTNSRKPKKLRKIQKLNEGISRETAIYIKPMKIEAIQDRHHKLKSNKIKAGYWRKKTWIMPTVKG